LKTKNKKNFTRQLIMYCYLSAPGWAFQNN